jgi:hypothetical protein
LNHLRSQLQQGRRATLARGSAGGAKLKLGPPATTLAASTPTNRAAELPPDNGSIS